MVFPSAKKGDPAEQKKSIRAGWMAPLIALQLLASYSVPAFQSDRDRFQSRIVAEQVPWREGDFRIPGNKGWEKARAVPGWLSIKRVGTPDAGQSLKQLRAALVGAGLPGDVRVKRNFGKSQLVEVKNLPGGMGPTRWLSEVRKLARETDLGLKPVFSAGDQSYFVWQNRVVIRWKNPPVSESVRAELRELIRSGLPIGKRPGVRFQELTGKLLLVELPAGYPLYPVTLSQALADHPAVRSIRPGRVFAVEKKSKQ